MEMGGFTMNDKRIFSKWRFLVISAVSLVLFSNLAFGATINVPTDYSTIQAAIDAASGGDTVLVADGTYTGEGNKNLDFKGKAITVQSENGAENCIIDCENGGRGFYFHSGEGTISVVSGFTITNGTIRAVYSNSCGGGIYCSSSSPTIKNCIIINNSCTMAGGGGPSGIGGGIYCYSSSPTITNCTISNNTVSGVGGAGGGIYCSTSSSPTIKNCIISGNAILEGGSRSSLSGGGIYCYSSSPTITNCIISSNFVSGGCASSGGGIYCSSSSYPTIMNCTISNNTASASQSSYGGGIYSDSSSPAITNCILWDNTPNEIYGDPDVTYSDINGGYTGLGNIDGDPLFVSSGVYELTANSPCVDAGTSAGAPSTDIDGNPRPQGLDYDMGAYEFFLASSVPTAATGSATNITLSSATLNGTLNPNGASTWYYFEYGTTTSYGSTTTTTSAGSGTTAVPVSADISGLDSGTYHYRLVGANSAGTNYGSDQTFVTSPSAPLVTTNPATSVTTNSATLNGTVNPTGASTTYYFEYGTTTSYGSTTTTTSAGSGTSAIAVSSDISGLELGTTYHFRLVATNSVGTTNGSDQTFTTNALAPSVTTDAATSVASDTATLNGTINPNGTGTTYYFEYGTTTTYGSTTTTTSAGSGSSTVSVNTHIKGLNLSTTYHYQLVATNSVGTSHGGDETFTTSTEPISEPTVITGSTTSITSSSATLNGTVNPNGSSTICYFEYGTTTAYDFFTASQNIGSGSSSVTVSATISDLISDTTYHYRLTATNSAGTSFGVDKTFSTIIMYVESSGSCGGNTPCYSTIQAAIDAAETGSVIRILQGIYDEDIIIDQPYCLTLSGGWDSTFTTQSSSSTVISMTIGDGTIEVDKLVIQ
jgi:parallel beta-helix repeat protein